MGKVYQLQQDYKSALDVSIHDPTVMHTYTHPHRDYITVGVESALIVCCVVLCCVIGVS